MPFWKIFSKKSTSNNNTSGASVGKSNRSGKREVRHTTEVEDIKDSPVGEKRNLHYNLSVSRSGRYKSKDRKRGALLEDPEFFKDSNDGRSANDSLSSNERVARGNCRDLEQRFKENEMRASQQAAAT